MSAINTQSTVQKQSTRTGSFLSTCLLVALGLLLSLAAASAAGACAFDPYAVPLAVGESVATRVWSDDARSHACFLVTVPESGLLAIELNQPVDAPRVFLRLAGTDLDGSEGFEVVRHGVGILLLQAGPGRYGVRVASTGALDGGASFRLTTRFAPYPTGKGEYDSELEIEPEGFAGCGFGKGEHDSELEIEPEGFAGCGFDKGEYDSELEIEPEGFAGCDIGKGEHDSELEIEPEGFAAPRAPSADLASVAVSREVRSALCSDSDSLLCAEHLNWNAAVRGEVANARVDEARVYRFEVTEVRPVAIRTQMARRSSDLAIELLDRAGQRLDDWATESRTNGRIVVLVPGAYFVRVQSLQGAPAHFELTIVD